MAGIARHLCRVVNDLLTSLQQALGTSEVSLIHQFCVIFLLSERVSRCTNNRHHGCQRFERVTRIEGVGATRDNSTVAQADVAQEG
jgi:hypothetical protein